MLDPLFRHKRFILKKSQLIKSDLESVWEFFTNIKSLQKLTPTEYKLAFINSDDTTKIYQGMILDLWIAPILSFPIKWQTEIIDICPMEEFTDVQNSGPFAYWKHRHTFTETSVGILIEDEIEYEIPVPILSTLINKLTIQNDLEKLFEFRKQEIDKIFNLK